MENLTVWGIITFGYDYMTHPVVEMIMDNESDAKEAVSCPSSLRGAMVLPHRNMRGYVKFEIGQLYQFSWDDVHVADEDKKKRIKEMREGEMEGLK